ncbi:MAG TPA: hypothetical protein VFD52_01400, partial [Clostridia bacterium]|nr:hypothetical protein [Clostridia bacterium]
ILFYLVQFTWALPQNLAGLIAFLILSRKNEFERFHYSFITYVEKKNFGGISLGIFIFINPSKKDDVLHDTKIHEYGHTIQALFLGPIWLLVVALPSVVWCGLPILIKYRKEKNVSYYWLYCEGWANLLGLKWSKEEFISNEFLATGRFGKPIHNTSKV